MCFQTGHGAIQLADAAMRRQYEGTHIFETKELVASVSTYGAGVGKELLERGGLLRIGVLLRNRVFGCWARRSLYRVQSQPLCHERKRSTDGARLEPAEEGSHGGGAPMGG